MEPCSPGGSELKPDDGFENASYTGCSLPPVDSGKDAWLFLAAGFMVEALTWGVSFSYGVFEEYYSENDGFKSSGNTAAIGTCALGISYLSAPVHFALLLGIPRFRRFATLVGFSLMCASLILGSFSTNTTHLILSQGIGFGLGAGLNYSTVILWLDEWFVQRRGLAFGILSAGNGLAGVIFPLTLQWLLQEYGFRTTLRMLSVLFVIFMVPLVWLIKPRIPTMTPLLRSEHHFDYSFLWSRTFITYQVCNFIEALGFFLPTVYLPSQARLFGVTGPLASLTVTLFNLASVGGCVMMGILVDRYTATTCIALSSIGTALCVFLVWGLCVSIVPLYIFSILYGLFAGSFVSIWPAIVRETKAANSQWHSTTVFGVVETGRGAGSIASGFLGQALLRHRLSGGPSAYGGMYGSVIIFTGVTALVSGICLLGRPLQSLRRL